MSEMHRSRMSMEIAVDNVKEKIERGDDELQKGIDSLKSMIVHEREKAEQKLEFLRG